MKLADLKIGQSFVYAAKFTGGEDDIVWFSSSKELPSDIFFANSKEPAKATSFEYFHVNTRKLSSLDFGNPLRDLYTDLKVAFAYHSNPGSLRRALIAIEDESKLSGVVTRTKLDKDKLFKILLTDLRVPLNYAESKFGPAPSAKGDEEKIGGSILYFPENARESNKKVLTDIMTSVHSQLSKHGLSKLFNGPIRFVKLTGKTIGYYEVNHKEMKISYNASKDKQTEYTILHEFAHKFEHEFIPDKAQFLSDKFREMRRGGHSFSNPESEKEIKKREESFFHDVKVGDTLIYNGRKKKFKGEWSVKSIKDGMLWMTNPEGSSFGAKLKWFMENEWTSKDHKVAEILKYKEVPREEQKESVSSWFPTKYSETSSSEWFAELFAFYIKGNLKDEPKHFIEGLIK